MANVQDKINTIEAVQDYVPNSIIIKSYDNKGLVLKWLEENQSNTADRKEKFIELDESEKQSVPKLLDRTAVSEIIVNNAV